MPVLEWNHNLDTPLLTSMFRSSDLRSGLKVDSYDWAAGAFWNSEFSVFCYGRSFERNSFVSQTSEISKSIYAWELPSEIMLTGQIVNCGRLTSASLAMSSFMISYQCIS